MLIVNSSVLLFLEELLELVVEVGHGQGYL
jgi:hypothetical protein